MKKIFVAVAVTAMGIIGCSKNNLTDSQCVLLSASSRASAEMAATPLVQPALSKNNSQYSPVSLQPACKPHSLPLIVDFSNTSEFPKTDQDSGSEIIRINHIYQ